MTGFRIVTVDEFDVLVNDGPADHAAGRITGNSAAALWTRQVLTDGRLRAVVLNSSAEDFVEVHRTAERVAAALELSGVDVAVWQAAATTEAAPSTPDDLVAALPDDDVLLLASGLDTGPISVRPATTARKPVHR